MLLLLRPSIVFPFFLFAALVGVGVAGARGAHERFTTANERIDADCRAYRSAHPNANVCRDDPYALRVVPLANEQLKKLEIARKQASAGDAKASAATIRGVLEVASRLDDHGTAIGTLLAAKLVDGALDILEQHRALFDPNVRIRMTASIRLRGPEHPLEGTRLATLYRLAHDPLADRGPIGEALLADAMLQDDAIYAEMDRAAAAGDEKRCNRAAAGRSGFGASGIAAVLCKPMSKLPKTQERIQRMTADAAREMSWMP
ncbi:MAG TPA: hypothetical protein VIF62_23740 [Labilithrix sp.]|jgi:hypothetical protein